MRQNGRSQADAYGGMGEKSNICERNERKLDNRFRTSEIGLILQFRGMGNNSLKRKRLTGINKNAIKIYSY